MIITKPGAEFLYDGETYRIGDTVVACWEIEYAGLIGRIDEIRTGKDKKTETETPEIVCCFNIPKLPSDVDNLMEILLYDFTEEKKEDSPLDSVIMSPEMLICPDNDKNKEKICVLTTEWANNDDGGFNTEVFSDYDAAKAALNVALDREMSYGLIAKWKDRESFKFEGDGDSYTAWVDGYYSELHYTLKIEEYKMNVSPDFVNRIGKRYLEKHSEETK